MKSDVCGIFVLAILLSCYSAYGSEDGRHSGHTHYKVDRNTPKNILKDKQYVRDYEHIKEDVQDMYNKDFSDKLDEMELEIFYFQLHDLDNNKKLDGLELLAAMNHVEDRKHASFSEEDLAENPNIRASLQAWWNDKFEEDAKYVDEIMKEEDLDQDGYLTYTEFAIGRQRDRGEI